MNRLRRRKQRARRRVRIRSLRARKIEAIATLTGEMLFEALRPRIGRWPGDPRGWIAFMSTPS